MLSYLFPGQGSQVKGMGKNLFKNYRDLVKKADEILGYSIEELCLKNPLGRLGQTQYTQPALYTVSCLAYLEKIKMDKKTPDFVAGHSMGEYCALFAADVFDFETGLRLIKKRGEIMSRAIDGGMAAVIGLEAEKINQVIQKNFAGHVQIANFNSIYQTVISGEREIVMNAKEKFEKAGAKMYMPLNVSGAFHSSLMEEAKKEFTAYLETFELKEPSIPVISNFTARPYKEGEVKKLLSEQLTGSVRWTESIHYLMGRGELEFEEVGPGTVLTKLVKKIVEETELLDFKEEDTLKSYNQQKNEEVVEATNASMKNEEVELRKPSTHELEENTLGSENFKKRYHLKYAYATGAMYKGVASVSVVVDGAKNGMLSFFGAGGLTLDKLEDAIKTIQSEGVKSYGMNLLHNPGNLELEEKTVDLYLKYCVPNIELAAFMSITPALARLRIKTLEEMDGVVVSRVNLMAKLSRPEVAEAYLRPVPEKIIEKLLAENKITQKEAEMARIHPVADDICAEADSGGHTDGAVAFALLPSIQRVRDDIVKEYGYQDIVHVGLAGGIGTPQAAAAAFMLGADFILTGSVNQCTVEAGTSDEVKNILQDINVQNTEYAPAGDMFEMGAKVQVVKKGILFPARANRLYELYRQYNSIDEINDKTKIQLEERYFGKTLKDIYEDCKEYWTKLDPAELDKAENNPKYKMAMIFKWYFGFSTRAAINGDQEEKVNFQIHCGPALGSFNQWVKGTPLEDWRNRSVGTIGRTIMDAAEKQFCIKQKTMVAGN